MYNTDVSETSRALSICEAEQNNQTDEAGWAAAAIGRKEQNVNVSSDDHRVCQQRCQMFHQAVHVLEVCLLACN